MHRVFSLSLAWCIFSAFKALFPAGCSDESLLFPDERVLLSAEYFPLPMKSALIGHTGFVGGNLFQQYPFTACFNSRNIEQIRAESFDLVVCAGVQAKKWWANQNPAEDWAGIQRLLDALLTVRAEKLVIISTIDVYPCAVEVNEASPIPENPANAYGNHRHRLEEMLCSFGIAHTGTRSAPGLAGT